MNEARMRNLAKARQVELTKKMMKRLMRGGVDLDGIIAALGRAELKEEDPLAYPDHNDRVGVPEKQRPFDVIVSQTADGRAIRIVGYIDRKQQ